LEIGDDVVVAALAALAADVVAVVAVVETTSALFLIPEMIPIMNNLGHALAAQW
jgi:hypothetical protein